LLTNLFLKGRLRHDLTAEEKRALEGAASRTITLGPRKTLVERGRRLEHSYYLVEGTMLRYLDDRNGERQLVQVNLAGDFVDLHGYAMKRLDHSVETLTTVKLAEYPHRAISSLVERFPHLARALWFSTLLDAAMHREWIFMLGRLRGEGRIAFILAELIERLRFIDRFDGRNFPIRLLQRDYAEACGISVVHANRCFKMLKQDGILALRGEGRMDILDEAGLKRLAQFTPDHLYGHGELALGSLRDR